MSTILKSTAENRTEILRAIANWYPTEHKSRFIDRIFAHTQGFEIGVGSEYEDDLIVHFPADIDARTMAFCMAQICQGLKPDECELLENKDSISLRLWWD